MEELIFKDFNRKDLDFVSATKNISELCDGKFVNITVTYTNGLDKIKISSSCEKDLKDNVKVTEGVKIIYKITGEREKFKRQHRVFASCVPSENVLKDLEFVEYLFHSFPDELKRVYL